MRPASARVAKKDAEGRMSQVASDKFLDLVRRSELIDADKLDRLLERIEGERGALPENKEDFSKLLIDEGLLTQWQADKLLAGKHRGFMLGKYKLLGQIGKGGMSHVYLAEHTLMRRRVAVKVLPRARVKDRSYLSRFQLEARAAARLDDPNIVRVYDIDNEGDNHYIVMEYVEGRDLHQTVTQDGPLKFNIAADYVAQVARGLEHAHQMGLVHRDIKPANCLVDHSNTVKLLDMGLAKLTDDETSLTLANEENVLGTADYLAPEQALNSHGADARADIYSLGCTLYFLLAGRPPFPEGSISERLLKHQVEQPDSLMKLRPETPLSLVDLCMRMMAKKPEDRPQTSGEVEAILNDWLSEHGYSPSRPTSGGGATHEPGSNVGAGVGSGILSRYVANASAPTGSSGVFAAGSDTQKLQAAAVDTDEDLSLAPLEDDQKKEKDKKDKQAASSSGVLSDESGTKISGSKLKGSSLSTPSGPPKSIFEEEEVKPIEKPPAKKKPQPKVQAQEGEYDPLHPPGYVNPQERIPAWVWIAFGLGALVVVVLILLIFGFLT